MRAFEWHLLKTLRDELRTDSRLVFNERIRELRRSPGGRWLAVLTVRGQLSVVDLEHDYRQTTVKLEPLRQTGKQLFQSAWFAFSPDDRYLYSAAHSKPEGESSPLLRFDLHSENPIAIDVSVNTKQRDCYSVAVAPDGRIASLGWSVGPEGEDGKSKRISTCVIRDPRTGDVLAEANIRGQSLAFSPDGRTLAVASQNSAEKRSIIKVLQSEDLEKLHAIPIRGFVRVVSFSADGTLLAANNPQGISVWDVSEGESDDFRLLYIVQGVGARILDVTPK